MATIPTQLPVASESPRDLKFNAGKIDEFVTSLKLIYEDRFGAKHYTIEGLRWVAQQAISAFGYITIDSFQDGATLTLPNHVLRDKTTGEYYRWDGDFGESGKIVPPGSTPDSTGGIGVGGWVSVGDASLRANLKERDGAWLLGYNESTVGDELDSIQFSKYVPSIYYGSFFENVSNAVNIVTSHDGITFSDPIRLKNPNGDLLRARDPSLVFYNGMWLMATTANTPGSVDLIIYSSLDLVSWVANPI
ncbi:hypothetical protein QZQ48_19850, partial [Serratia marcescens]|nr:hypothetical protein [Serratia marcescens]MDP8626879.1 hypothetical protein [Serratia marcescens]MDP8676313.1 hypothetical protein [Serratia marcescens]MDP8691316.1 hypothetical protein [Serratia marcescens]MDP8700973.1 hypothetical protein [Serratia marcescens]